MWTVVAALVASLTLAAQTEEVHISSRPYIPFRLRVDSNHVTVNVVVRDRTGKPVSGLKQSDFRLFEEGKPREIVTFAVEHRPAAASSPTTSVEVPSDAKPIIPAVSALRFITLYFDDFGTAAGDLAFTKNAAKHFVEESLSPADRVAVFTTSSGRLTPDYSADRKEISSAIDRVQTHSRFSQSDTAACPRITPLDAYKITVLMDEAAIHSAITESNICGLGLPADAPPAPRILGRADRLSPQRSAILNQSEQIWGQVRVTSQNTLAAISSALGELYRMPGPRTPGSRVLLLVSSGFLTGTLERERDLIVDQALRAGVVINSLDAKGLFAEAPGRPLGEDQGSPDTPPEVYFQETINAIDRQEEPAAVLASVAAATGGLYFHHNNGFSQGFRELGATPETTYLLGFRIEESALDNKFHKLRVSVTADNRYGVQSRPGYFAALKTASPEEKGRAELERQVTSPDVLKGLSTTVVAQADAKTAKGVTPLHVKMHVDLKGVEFPEQNGRRMQKLTFVFALLDQDNTIVAAREGEMDFSLTEAKFGALVDSGISAILTLEAPPGVYKLRTVAIEGVQSKIGTLQYAVKLP